jgi:hypothetical protein
MGSTFRFIEAPGDASSVMSWFRALPRPPVEVPTARGHLLHFRELGPLAMEAGHPVAPRSPVVSVLPPRVRRGILWTVGEVHFLATPLRQLFPGLQRVSLAFRKWLARHECVYPGPHPEVSEWAYHLEGSVQNHDSPIYAFPSGSEALRKGQYFVGDDDNELVLDQVCAALRLRGLSPDPGPDPEVR